MTFTYCGKTPEDFGCRYIPDEKQISDLMSRYEQFAKDFEARDGGYYFGERQPPKEFELPCYYEDIDKKTMEQIVRWLDRRTSGHLVFDERPDVYYDVVPSAKIEFEDYSYTKYGNLLHAGEFTIYFTAYDPFGRLTKKFLQDGEETDYSANLLPENQMPPAPQAASQSFQVYNPGTENTGLTIRVAGDASNGLTMTNTANGQVLKMQPFTGAITNTVGKWFEIDSEHRQVWLKGAASQEMAFEYHDEGYIHQLPSMPYYGNIRVSYSSGSNTIMFSSPFVADSSIVGLYINIGTDWKKIMSVNTQNNTATTSGVFSENGTYNNAIITVLNEITIQGESASLTKLEIDYTPKVR